MYMAAIVPHPDDETLWCGGRLLALPKQDWLVVTLCRASDAERAKKLERACRALGAHRVMADLVDEPLRTPLESALVQETFLSGLPRLQDVLSAALFEQGARILPDSYGFDESGTEAPSTPAVEAFYVHSDVARLARFIEARGPAP